MRWNLLIAAVAASWGFVSVIVAGVELRGEALVFWRCLLAALTVPLLLAALGRVRLLVVRTRRAHVVGIGVLLALHWVLFFATLARASVAVAILTIYTAPVFLAVLAPLLLPERRSRVGLVALAVSAPGIALIALAGEGGARADALAIGLGLAAALTYALVVVWTKAVVAVASPVAVAFWSWVSAAAVLPAVLVGGARVLPTAAEWPAVVALGVVLTGLLGVVYITALRRVTAQSAGLLSYVEPVSAALLAWAILGQGLGWQVAVGGVAVVAGGALVVLREPAAEAPPVEAPTVAEPRSEAV